VFQGKAYGVEHVVNMYAKSYIYLQAKNLYDDKSINKNIELIKDSHIYFVGITQKVQILNVKQEFSFLIITEKVLNKKYDIIYNIPKGLTLEGDFIVGWNLVDGSGRKYMPAESDIIYRLSREFRAVNFEVVYIGQAYGKNGSRNCVDRLTSHETLQKISLKGVSEGYEISIYMFPIEPDNRIITRINPHAKNRSEDDNRIKNGIKKLRSTTEAEKITLYEASMIKYFQPKYNKEFMNSFPSTNMKCLEDCYEKDISGVVAEICIDELPALIFSSCVQDNLYHVVKHDLHSSSDRSMFFGR